MIKKDPVDWDKLKCFYAVATEGNVSTAAKKIGMAQSNLTRAILILEESLQKNLFMRASRGVVLTEDGKVLFEHVRKMTIEFENALSLMDKNKNEVGGHLKLTTSFGFASTSLFHHLGCFVKEYPTVNLTLICDDQDLDLKTREADVSIRPFVHDDDSLIQEHILTRTQHLYASSNYLKIYGTPKVLSDLKNHRIVMFGNPSIRLPYSEVFWLSTLCSSELGWDLDPYMVVNSVECLYQAAIADIGIISLSNDSRLLHNKDLVRVLPDMSSPEVKVYCVYPVVLNSLKAVRSLADFLKSAYRQYSLSTG